MAARWEPRGPVGRLVHSIEETAIALLLGLMVLLTFANVVLRKLSGWAWLREQEAARGFDIPDSILWGQDVVTILFAWLVILGVSYGFKITAHLGVDALTNVLPAGARRAAAIGAAAVCIVFAALLLKGGYDFWAPFANLDQTDGRWFPTGFKDTREQGYATERPVPIPFGADWLAATFNSYEEDGKVVVEEYDYLPRLIPYLILPFGMALILFRVIQASVQILRGARDSLIVSHEAEEAVEEVAATHADPAVAAQARSA